MSVNSVRVFMEKSGCGIAIGVVLAVVLIAGLGFQCNNQGQAMLDSSPAVAEVAGVTINAAEVDSTANLQLSYFGAALENLPASFETNVYHNAMKELFNQARMVKLGQTRGISLRDEDILKGAEQQFDKAYVEWKQMKIDEGVLKADSTTEEVAAKFKEELGKTFEEIKKERMDGLKDQLLRPDQRNNVIAGHVRSMLYDDELSKLNISDDELKRAFQTADVKKIVLDRAKVDGGDARKFAQEIVEKVKSGEYKFEQAMDRFSHAAPIEGKRLSETIDKIALRQALTDESMVPLRTANKGDIVVIDSPVGAEVIFVVDIVGDVPADFESAKDRHRRDVLGPRANEIITKLVEELAAEYPVSWKSPGYEVLYEVSEALSNLTTADYERRVQVLEPLYERSLTAQSDLVGRNMATLASYTAIEGIWDRASEEQRKAWADKYLAAIDTIVSVQPKPALIFQKIEILAQQGNPAAWDALVDLAVSTRDLTPAGQQRFSQIFRVEDQLTEKGLANEAAAAKIQAEYDRWNADKVMQEQAEAEAAKRMEEERKRFEEEEKKRAEEAASGATSGTSSNEGR
ncbi:MAG: hypothetical protein ACK4XJ_01685 [Fimbriimonadaceae bacterium]